MERKLVTVGDGGCGKTCLLIAYAQGHFAERYVPTVFENYITTVQHRGREVQLALWDTAGQEEYDRLRPLSYPETDAVLICFAIDMVASLDSVQDKWFPEVKHFCPDAPVVLVGCKLDLREHPRAIEILASQGLAPITHAQGASVAKSIKAKYVECSSKTMYGIKEVISTALDASAKKGARSRKKNCIIL